MAGGNNILVNGSFENPAQGAGTFAAHVAVPGWTALLTAGSRPGVALAA